MTEPLRGRQRAELGEHLHLVEDCLVVDDLAAGDLEVVDEPQVQLVAGCATLRVRPPLQNASRYEQPLVLPQLGQA